MEDLECHPLAGGIQLVVQSDQALYQGGSPAVKKATSCKIVKKPKQLLKCSQLCDGIYFRRTLFEQIGDLGGQVSDQGQVGLYFFEDLRTAVTLEGTQL